MKKLIFALLGIVMLASCGNKYSIKGKTDVVPDGANVYMCTLEQGVNPHIVDSALVSKGKFCFSGTADSCEVRLLVYALTEDDTPLNSVVYIEPGTIKVTFCMDEVKVGGTKINNRLQKYYDDIDEITLRIEDAQAKIKESVDNDSDITSYVDEIVGLQQQYLDVISATIYENADNTFGMEQLLDNYSMYEPDEVESFLNALEPTFGQTYYVKELRQMVEVKKKLLIGGEYQNFTTTAFLNDNLGEASLSDYIGGVNRLTLLDFWASWCEPCKDEIPYLKAAYEKFHANGLEIVSVSVDNNQEKWIEGFKSNEMTWPQMLDKQNGADCPNALYGLKTIPSSYLFDAEGRIVAVNLRGEDILDFIGNYLGI